MINIKSKVVVISGGAGLIGSHFAELIIKNNGIPIVLDNCVKKILKLKLRLRVKKISKLKFDKNILKIFKNKKENEFSFGLK